MRCDGDLSLRFSLTWSLFLGPSLSRSLEVRDNRFPLCGYLIPAVSPLPPITNSLFPQGGGNLQSLLENAVLEGFRRVQMAELRLLHP